MSVSPFGGVLGSVAGAPVSQTQGSEAERAKSESSAQARETDSQANAEKSVGETQEDQGASDRDADGRRLWENPSAGGEAAQDEATTGPPRRSKDASGDAGGSLDLLG